MGALVWEKANWRSSTPIEPGINTRMCSGCHWSTTSKISSPDGYKSYTNTLHAQVKTLAEPLAKRLTKRLTQPIAPQLMTSQLHRSKLLLAMVLKSRANNCSWFASLRQAYSLALEMAEMLEDSCRTFINSHRHLLPSYSYQRMRMETNLTHINHTHTSLTQTTSEAPTMM